VGQVSAGVEQLKKRAGVADKSNDELVEDAQDAATGEWETVQRKGKHVAKKASDAVEQAVDEKLTPAQKAQLKKGVKDVKRGAEKATRQAEGWSANLVSSVLSAPQLRPAKAFILRNNLSLPVVILGALLSLWLSLSLIRLATAGPKQPEFDIHDKESSMAWLKFHAGDYKDRAVDMRDSLSARSAAFLANNNWEKLQKKGVDYREIGMKRLGLSEPTWGEWAWARITGRPLSWQDRVTSTLSLARAGINRKDIQAQSQGLLNKLKNSLPDMPTLHREPTAAERAQGVVDSIKAKLPGQHETTLGERIQDGIDSIRSHLPGQREPTAAERAQGIVDSIKAKLPHQHEATLGERIHDGIDSIRSHLPGGESIEAAKQRAYDATHQSTLDKVKSGATYVKNRIVHGAEEAAHKAEDAAKRAADEARYKAGL
jgi:hypothetical protein